MNQYQKSKGFTLIELMVTVAIMGIMAAIAFPSMSNFISNTRLTNRSQQVANIFRFAKSESVRMGVPVVVCGVTIRSDGRHTGVCNSDANSGLMAFADNNRDGNYTADTDMVLRTVSINGNESDVAVRKMMVVLNICDFAGSDCKGGSNSKNQFVFMPNGAFGYRTALNTTRANFLSSVTMSQAYLRVAISDTKNKNIQARYVVVSPSGSTTVCKAGDTNYKAFDSDKASSAKRICAAA
ncbi:GspH/FimT family pseudopilin [Kingella kingae]|uniref:GspH/FimT family pseudopilin n=1 Tax=Kingella kingae TaxID=504 RepID=UPI00050A26B1|nr:GspH/FimT family pseudopilin [Kingella kingae]MDK4526111.1 GspH/FimT family pseudopilin [Kingella kingae]MDK4533253.1 GspH/FimT family pseudopilin [Kingella kingae]